jgi:hypothetical protein
MLMLHAGAKEIGYDDLRAVNVPQATDTHIPVPHHEIVELARYTLGFHGHEIMEEHHAITEDGMRYFGLMSLRSPYGNYADMLGLRNSHDKSFPMGLRSVRASSSAITLLSFPMAKRELPALVTDIVAPLQAQRIAQNQKLIRYQGTPLSDQVAARHDLLPLAAGYKVVRLYFAPLSRRDTDGTASQLQSR